MKKGFTIVEMLTAIFIILIIIALAVPSFSGHRKNKEFSSASKILITAFQTARSYSISKKTDHYVVFAPAASPNNLSDHAFKIVEDTSTNLSQKNIVTVDDWTYLPARTKCAVIEDVSNYLSMGFPNDTNQVASIAAIKFEKGSGRVTQKKIFVVIRGSYENVITLAGLKILIEPSTLYESEIGRFIEELKAAD